MNDPVEQFDHDHGHLTKLTIELRGMVQAVQKGEQSAAILHGPFAAALDELREGLIHHFAREEEGLFPFVAEHLPDLQAHVARLAAAHDATCGALVRMSHVAEQDAGTFAAQFTSVAALFGRFEAAYSEHARDEHDLLEALPARLEAHHRAQLRDLLEGL